MHRVFNCGIGMAIIVDAAAAPAVLTALAAAGEQAWRIGEIVERPAGEPATIVR